MTEKEFLKAVMEMDMPDTEQVRQICLKQAKKQEANVKKIWRQRLATAIVSVLVLISAGSGICYAATGEGPVRLFRALFEQSDSEAVAQIENAFAEPDTVLSFDNMEFTIERYFFDKEQGVIFGEMTLQTVDGSPVISFEEAYAKAQKYGFPIEGNTADEWKKLCQEDPEQYQEYKYICEFILDTDEFSMLWPLDDYGGNTVVEMENDHLFHFYAVLGEESLDTEEKDFGVNIIYKDQDVKEKSVLRVKYQNETVGDIPMENTGTLKWCDVDEAKIADCTKVKLSGAFIQIYYEGNSAKISDIPFDKIEVTMKDGNIYRWEKGYWDFSDDQEKLYPTDEKEYVSQCLNGGITYHGEGNVVFSCSFMDFLNTDNIISVAVDDVECLKLRK